MIEVEAAKILKEDSCWECSLGTLHGATQCGNTQCNVARATKLAVEALEQLALYKQGGLCLVPANIYEKQCKELDELKEKQRPVIYKGYYGCKKCGATRPLREKSPCCHYCGKGFDWENPERLEV